MSASPLADTAGRSDGTWLFGTLNHMLWNPVVSTGRAAELDKIRILYTIYAAKEDLLQERFTERVRKILHLARDEALKFKHNFIGTEHLLLAMIKEGEGVGAMVLINLGIELNELRKTIEN